MTPSASSSPRRLVPRDPPPPCLRLILLALAAAAFLLVPAAQAAAAEFPLNVEITGSGEGAVGCKANGGPVEECEAEYLAGTEVTVIAEPEVGTEFVSWEGCDSAAGDECEVEMDAERTVEATFDLEEFELTVETEGSGEGVVECQAEGGPYELCPESETYSYGTEVTLFAESEQGSEFVEWSGDCTGVEGECDLTVEEPLSVTAIFDLEPTPDFALEVNTDGTGEGEVECEVEAGPVAPCEAEYEEGTEVALVPEAETGSEFVEWSGDCTGSGACELTVDEDESVTATFDLEPEPEEEFALTIVKAGTGSGSVTCNAGACASTYSEGAEVTLAATAASGSAFSGWSGGGCSGTGACVVTIDEDRSVTATFTANPSPSPKPEETCATNASLCPPPPTAAAEGTAKAATSATVKGGKAALKLTCTGGPCKGTLQLTAKVKQGKKTKNLVIGRASFNLAGGASTTLTVKLSGPAKQELARGKTIKAKAGGDGVSASTVKLKPAKK